jgi:hypothetical protein
MKNAFHTLKSLALTLLLAGSVIGLALVAGGTSVGHAAIMVPIPLNLPSIATSSGVETIQVSGSNFTPGGVVEIVMTDDYSNILGLYFVRATSARTCNYVGLCYLPGAINTSINLSVYQPGEVCSVGLRVYAYDYSTGKFSNRTDVIGWCGR